jgi:DNA-binding PadR family transcriptional regulator
MDRKSKTKYVILGILSDRPSLSGYDIKKLIERRFRFFWSESYGQIYPELRRLLGEKSVKTAAERSGGRKKGGRKRRLYSITEKGRMEVFDWLALPPEKETVRFELLLKLCFGSLIYGNDLLTNIRAFQARSKENLAGIRAVERELEAARRGDAAGARENDPYVLLAVKFSRMVCEAHLEWSAEAESAVARR